MFIKQIKAMVTCKKLLAVAALVLFSLVAKAQYIASPAQLNTPPAIPGAYYNEKSITLIEGFSLAPTGTNSYLFYISCGVPLAATPSANQNYIVTSVPRNAGIIPGTVNLTTCDLMQTVQYFDGLGRPLQTVQVKGSPGYRDVIQPTAYDAFGREAIKYLPYADDAIVPGSYRANALSSAAGVLNFYYPSGSTATSGLQQANGVVYNPQPFAQTNFEASPLNRVLEQGAPGTDWQPVAGATTGHTMKMVYTANDQTSTFSSAPGNSNMGSRIVALYNVTINADQSRTLSVNGTYQASQLYVTIAKNENWNAANDGCTNTTEEYKNKEGQVILKRTYNLNTSTNKIEELSTYYVYDDLGNLAFVLPPGANPDAGITSAANQTTLDNFCYQYRYDERNRLTQKKLPGKGWDYMVYNKLDQVVLTQDANQRTTNQWMVSKYDALGRVIISGLWNAGSAIAQSTLQNSIYTSPQWDVRNAADTNTGYTISSYPALSQLLSISYYDDYNIPGLSATPYATAPAGVSNKTRGLTTASKTAILNSDGTISSNMLWSVNYYDDEGRVMQTYKQHYLGGIYNVYNYDVINSSYNFTGDVLNTTRQHYTKNSGGTAATLAVTITNRYEYDHMGRKTNTYQQTGAGATEVQLSKNEYNEIGQLKTKTLGGTLQAVGYTYNERGWMRTETTGSNLFSMELKYNQPDAGTTAQYNGNIAQMNYLTTRVTTPGNRTFGYSYDNLNRLTNAAFTGGTANDALNEQITYDVMGMGNITQLTRGGLQGGILNYISYTGNQLNTVTGYSARTYLYDANGNARSDGMGKDIGYNLLNLPREVKQGSTLKASYTYDATGQKLRNTGSDGSWDYISGIVYNNNAISFIQTEEGRAKLVPANGTYNYEYNIKDHLGNTRVSIDQFNNAARVIQEDEYYSFGLRKPIGGYDNSSLNRYLYNGKEVQTDLGNQYDYGARFYDPVIARWTSVDPKSETSRRFSPYTYGDDNSIRNIDPDGMETEEANCCGVHFISALPGSPLNKAIDWVADQLGFPTTKEVTKVITGTATPEEKGALKVKTMYSIVNILTMGEGGEGEGGAGGEGGGKYSGLKEPKTVGDGLKTTPAQRGRILEANKTANGGTLKSDLSGKPLDPPVQAKKGVKANMNQAEVDHVQERAKGGSNSNSNQRVLSKRENLDRNKTQQ